MSTRTTLGWMGLCVLVTLGLLVLAGYPWLSTELTVRRILARPGRLPSDQEVDVLYEYIRGDLFSRLPGTSISDERQRRLVNMAVQPAMTERHVLLLDTLGEKWRKDGSFSQLPEVVADRVLHGAPNVEKLLPTFGWRRGTIDPYMDVDSIMLHAQDDKVVVSCCLILTMDTLLRSREACLRMLQRKDIGRPAKSSLVGRIVGAEAEAQWFGSKTRMKELLSSWGVEEPEGGWELRYRTQQAGDANGNNGCNERMPH